MFFLLLTLLPIVGAKALWLALFVFVLLWGGIAKERGHENGSGEVGWWAALREWCIYLDESEFAALDAYTVGPRRGELGKMVLYFKKIAFLWVVGSLILFT